MCLLMFLQYSRVYYYSLVFPHITVLSAGRTAEVVIIMDLFRRLWPNDQPSYLHLHVPWSVLCSWSDSCLTCWRPIMWLLLTPSRLFQLRMLCFDIAVSVCRYWNDLKLVSVPWSLLILRSHGPVATKGVILISKRVRILHHIDSDFN